MSPAGILAKLSATTDRELELVGVGEAMVELWSEGRLSEAPSLRRAYGGDVLNTLVMAARLGASTGFVTRVGKDPFGAALREAWRGEGVGVDHAPLVDGVNGVYFISRSQGGEREFSYRRSGSAAAGLSAADIDADYLARARVLLVSGVTQAISKGAQAAALKAAELARERGVVVAYDPNYRPALWAARAEDGVQAAQAAFQELLPLVDILLVSEPGDLAVVGQADEPGPTATHGDGPATPSRVAPSRAEAYHYRFARSAVGRLAVGVKRGAEGGALLLDGEEHRGDVPSTQVVDTTGAGDAWNAGLIHALASGRSPADAVRAANAVAAWKIARYGAVPRLDLAARRSLHDAYGA